MRKFFFILITLFTILIPLQAMNEIEIKVPDFRFPANVSKDAQATLKQAIAQRDGHAIVASLVQYGLAETSISQKNVEDVCQKIDEVLAADGLLSADIRALVLLLRADIINAAPYGSHLTDHLTADWAAVLDPLGNGDVSALNQPLSEYADLILPGNEWGSRCIPTLYDFLMMQVASHSYFSYEQRQAWLSRHLTDADVMPRLYIEQYIAHGSLASPWDFYSTNEDDLNLYQKYEKYPESGLFLLCRNPEDKYYEHLKTYLQRHPSYVLAANVQNLIAKIEDCRVSISYPSLIQSTDGLQVKATSRNVNEFTLTLYRLPKTPEMRSAAKWNVKDFTAVQTRVLRTEGQVPFDKDELTTTFDPVPYGQYIVLSSYKTPEGLHADSVILESRVSDAMLSVSDIRTFSIVPEKIIKQQGRDCLIYEPKQVFAVNSQTGAPIAEAKVDYAPQVRYGQKGEVKSAVTNADGYALVGKDSRMEYRITKDKDIFMPFATENGYYYDREIFTSGLSIHTDLGIYRPGEEIRLSIVAWNNGYNLRQPVAELKLKLMFKDASGNDIESKEVTTDAMGQAVTEFKIPTDRMNGRFSIRANSVDSEIHYYETRYIDVSEYKTPTFFIDLSDTQDHQLSGESAKIKGRVMTYSGMPVADAEVQCRLTAHNWFWWYGDDGDFIPRDFTVRTDQEGRFEYVCPAEWTAQEQSDNARRPYYTYTLNASCTNAAGETHEGRTEFWIGHSRGLTCSDATLCLEPGKPAGNLVTVISSDPEEKSLRCHYQLKRVTEKNTNVVKEGDFLSDKQQFDFDQVPSGKYILSAYIIGEEKTGVAECSLILYRENDALPPFASSLWMPEHSRYMDEKGHIRVLLGNTTTSHIYYVVGSRQHILKSGWVKYEPGLHWFEAQMPMEADENVTIHFYTVYNGETFSGNASFSSPLRDEVRLTSVSFRDKIQPGSTEHWTFHLTDQEGNPVQGGRMMLELYNEALHSLSPNNWNLQTSRYIYTMHDFSHPSYAFSRTQLNYDVHRALSKRFDISLPHPNYYNHSFYKQTVSRLNGAMRLMVDDFAVEANMAVMPEPAVMHRESMAVMKAAASGSSAPEAEESKPAMSDVAVRADEVKVALWQPQLTFDAEGNSSIEFDVPNFNTTYHFQAIAYNSRLCSDYLRKTVLAQRPIMVQSSLPRFLRAGDSIELAASIMNATDTVQPTEVLIELFDPRTNEVLDSLTQQYELAAHGTEVLRISYEAPLDAPYVGFRVKALAADGNGDGEQQLLPILSNITPVIETQPFYLQPHTADLGLDILTPASANGNARLTLEYCNNPTWYCITALPTIIDADAITSPALAHNLFALSLAARLSAENPLVAEAVAAWKQKQGQEGDVLVSALQQNDDLKISPLLASPWLPEAQRQTLRMQALDQLFDAERNERLLAKLIHSLQLLQAKDGGFMWLDFNGTRNESSYWATAVVLELIGDLHHLGCLPDDALLHNLITEAVHYYDKETLRQEEEMLKNAKKYKSDPDYFRFWSYVYTRQMLASLVGYSSKSEGRALFKLTDKTLSELEKNWGSLAMTSRARAAVTLLRAGRTTKARSVMESVRQFAMHDANKGMYWESLERSGFSPVACTSAMLQAFAEVSPRQDEIDEMRQWLLLEKQTSDWGSSSMAIDAVYAILNTGSDWLHASTDSVPQFEIRVDGQCVDVSQSDRLLGYVRMSLPADAKRVEVTRTGEHPAWGSLYHQFAAPMTEVKAQGVDELSIQKHFVRVDADGKTTKLAEGDSLHIGDRIRTTLTIKATKDLEYVTLIDQRPAFLEPVDQKSHYTRTDRFYYYLETKDAATNAFITRLPEGTHILSYDCHVTAPGTFTSGIATVQSQYAPQFVAHSAGELIKTYK